MNPGPENVQSSSVTAWLYVEELTHRALNDYTAMLAIVHCASLAVSDDVSGRALADVAFRLRSAAKISQALRAPEDDGLRDLDLELESLCAAISDAVLSCRGIRLTLLSDPITLDAYRCWKIALAVSELVINASRHAFRSRSYGSITIDVRVRNGNVECAVIDDGSSLPTISPGRGTAILDALAVDLGGTIARCHTNCGSTITLCVPLVKSFGASRTRSYPRG